MSYLAFEPAPDAPHLTVDAAMQLFAAGIKPSDQHRIGIEAEAFIVDAKSLMMQPHAVIARVIERMCERLQLTPIQENGYLLGAENAQFAISLEPGGQFELSLAPCENLAAVRTHTHTFYQHLADILPALHCDALSMGLHPLADFARVPLIPKMRAALMAPRLEEAGHLARHMMRGTCGWQCAIDYASEHDAITKMRALYHVTSIISALFANSGWEQGAPNGFAAKRLAVWLDTDPSRCGFIRDVFAPRFGFDSYLHYAWQVPLLFLIRAGTWIPVRDRTFAQFVSQGYEGHYATSADWQMHLSTLFPEIRLKHYLEVRDADANAWPLLHAHAALVLGITASDSHCEAAIDLTRGLRFAERLEFHLDVARRGLAATLGRARVSDIAHELLAIAQDGLTRRDPTALPELEQLLLQLDAWQPAAPDHAVRAFAQSAAQSFLLSQHAF